MADLARLSLDSPKVVVLAEGDHDGARNNAQGHLFEKFMAKVFAKFGCEEPRRESLNVRAIGIELDVVVRLRLSGQKASVECKAYSSNVPASSLSQFYGKLSALRLEDEGLHGWFVAIPTLTSDGLQLARAIEAKDSGFRLVTATDIAKLVGDAGWITPPPADGPPTSDEAIVVTPHGVFSAAKRLDPETMLPVATLVWARQGDVPAAVLRLIEGSDYGSQLPAEASSLAPQLATVEPHQTPKLVRVSESSSDFEYQFPASPRFFVGRREVLGRTRQFVGAVAPQSRVFVLNAQSGWGKSSLALKIGELFEASKGHALVLDSRTAQSPEYVWAALRRAAMEAAEKGVLKLPADAKFGGFQSALQTLNSSEWKRGAVLLFFDQFENVFRDARLTQEFRDLSLSLRELTCPFFLGFAWKTDLVGWTEKHPYALRDEIRASAEVVQVQPFGPSEVSTLLTRLSKQAGTKLSKDLRQRIREYSQGLPWLLKKLANHLLGELTSGATEESLLGEALNVQSLFERDLSELQPPEEEALRSIARLAPVAVSELVERIPAAVVQSLVDRRLVVRVGDSLDVYWDTFRDFLNTGKVAVPETYILRQRPASAGRVLREVVAGGGDVGVSSVAEALKTSVTVIHNAARDLRQLGVLASAPNRLKLATALAVDDSNLEDAIRARVARALRRHLAFSIATSAAQNGLLSFGDFAERLPSAFPAIQAKESTWNTYSFGFAQWFAYSGIAEVKGQTLVFATGRQGQGWLLRSTRGAVGARAKTFPASGPKPTFEFAAELVNGSQSQERLGGRAREKAQSNLLVLGLVDSAGKPTEELSKVMGPDGTLSPSGLAAVLDGKPVMAEALNLLRARPTASPKEVGECLRDGYGVAWADGTSESAGKYFRSWAKAAGVMVRRPSARTRLADQAQLSLLDKEQDRHQ